MGGGIFHLIEELLQSILEKKYSKVITLGSSKGGSCAILYGLKIGANDIYSGACQYYIGSYLNTVAHKSIFEGMMGKGAGIEQERVLNSVLPDCLSSFSGDNTLIHLFYSKKEHTYEEHIAPLIKDLNTFNIPHTDTVVDFTEHAEVGKHFGPYIKQELLGYK